MRRLVLVFVFAQACAACPQATTTTPDAPPDASVSVLTCETLTKLHCALGADPDCPGRVDLAVRDHHTTLAAVICAETATSRPAVAACGPYFACGAP